MEFNLHPVAVKSFNEEAVRLYKGLICYPICISKKEKNSFRPDYFISSNLTEKDIVGELKSSTTNWIGNEVAISFYYEGKKVGLCQVNYKNLIKLSESIQRVPQLSPFVSVSFIKNAIFDWMRGKYLDELSCGMIEYVVQLCEKEVVESEIWIPLTHTHIQSEIKIGKIILKTITKELLNEWIDRWDINSEIRERSKKEFMDQYQEMLQGIAAATICLYAEPQRANEIAAEEAEKAASILRIFSPGVCHPKIISCCTLIGTEHIKINKFFQIKDNKILRITEEMTNKPWIPWILKNEFIDMIRNNGLDILSDVLLQKNKKDFQSQVLNSLYMYSRCALAINVEDKLIYILVAIESVLLKNDSESIQQNIGERMAILVERTAEKRKQVIKKVKEVYAARSGFIHHGRTIDETESIATFMFNSYRFFQILIMDINKFENKLEFIEKIEEIKLSWGGT
jgi:hypothetical protein